jgi:hypothetical protein
MPDEDEGPQSDEVSNIDDVNYYRLESALNIDDGETEDGLDTDSLLGTIRTVQSERESLISEIKKQADEELHSMASEFVASHISELKEGISLVTKRGEKRLIFEIAEEHMIHKGIGKTASELGTAWYPIRIENEEYSISEKRSSEELIDEIVTRFQSSSLKCSFEEKSITGRRVPKVTLSQRQRARDWNGVGAVGFSEAKQCRNGDSRDSWRSRDPCTNCGVEEPHEIFYTSIILEWE